MLSQPPFFYGYKLFDEPFMLLSNAFFTIFRRGYRIDFFKNAAEIQLVGKAYDLRYLRN